MVENPVRCKYGGTCILSCKAQYSTAITAKSTDLKVSALVTHKYKFLMDRVKIFSSSNTQR